VAVPRYAPELLDFQSWGLDVIDPEKPDPEFPYLADAELRERRHLPAGSPALRRPHYPGNLETLKRQPIAKSIRAFAAGAYTTWPAYWLHTYRDYAENLERLTEVIENTDPNVGD
jgi:iron complex transport system substrate-binding protein